MSGTAFDFPASPTVGQTVTTPGGIFVWNGTTWTGAPNAAQFLALSGGTMTGPINLSGAPAAANQPVNLSYMQVNASPNNIGRNVLHNAQMLIQQRGVGPWTTSVYTADRWALQFANDTASVSLQPHNDTSRTQIGDEAAVVYLANAFTGNAAAGALTVVWQAIEGVRRLAGKTIIISFWAAASTSLKLGVSFDQGFGTGGSPSAPVFGTGQSVTVGASWTRYSLSFAIPSAAGKTFGTNNNDYTTMYFWFSSGSTSASRSGNVGVQSGTINLWGIQLEIAQPGQTQPTPLEKLDPVLQLQQAQRFYQVGTLFGQVNLPAATAVFSVSSPYPVWMRATPTLVMQSNNSVNFTTPTMTAVGSYTMFGSGSIVTGGNQATLSFNFAASADF